MGNVYRSGDSCSGFFPDYAEIELGLGTRAGICKKRFLRAGGIEKARWERFWFWLVAIMIVNLRVLR